ncbi:MAG TPA: elongation factor G [Candidatus Paceibacterota bacterium]|nr:elongation factor G [Candidatus Paceibacterota bacterium]
MAREYLIEKNRNIGIIAHIDAGKTTVSEGVLYLTGKTHKIGKIDEGDTQLDWMEQERERGITITAAATTCFWKPKRYIGDIHRINIIDTPGHIDFTVEVQRSLRVLDGAVVIFDGKMGVEPQSETVWHQADKFGVPRICFVNKINQTGGDFYMSLKSIRERLSLYALPIQLPVGFEKDICGVVDLIKMKSYVYNDYHDKELIEGEIPENMKADCEKYRQELLEKVAESNDELMGKYLEGKEISEEELVTGIRKSTLVGKIFPIMCGDGRGVIVETLLDAIINYLPSPADIADTVGSDITDETKKIARKASDDEPFSALAFKIATDPFVGSLTFFRVYSGKLQAGSYVLNSSNNSKERIGRILRMHANQREEVKEIFSGEIGAAVGLKDTTTGDTLCDPDHPIVLEKITFPDPVIYIAIEPKTKADQEKMGMALKRLADEDPTFKIRGDEETGQTIISGMGELHLEIIVDRMKREFKVEANVGRPQVAYKETIKKTAEAEGKYIRQSGGRGQYGHVWLKVEPLERGKGFEFLNEIRGGIIPSEYIPAIKKGAKEAMDRGVLAGYPLVDAKVTLYDGSYHEVDSSEAAFKMASSFALQAAVKRADLILLEPIMNVEVIIPQDFLGDITGDLNSKRARIENIDDRLNMKVIDVKVSLAEMFGYATKLRSMTQGRGSFTMEFSCYEEVPRNVAQEIIEGKKK